DLDGDGFTDLFALGRWKVWVFYGSERGFSGTLTPAQADASLVWPHDESARRADFAKTLPLIIGDLNGDGAADLGFPNQAELGIVYGTKQRWSGRNELTPDLTVARASADFPERSWWLPLADDLSYAAPLPELVDTQIRVGVANLDGDGQRELVVHESRYPEFETTMTTALYTLKGPNQGATGRYVLSDANLYRAEGVSDPGAALSRGVLLDPGGDFDGDGSTDFIFGVIEDPEVFDTKASLHIVPGTPRAPD
ncbi:MAG TPA: VCBS repeat-containing protein, partial [Polyangiales bacterium]|nr:VCBS repeat-containing protein [Polyangiales bacterium]